MANFLKAIGKTLKWEGGYTVDTGGRTQRGVTEKVWNLFKSKTGKFPGVDVAQISESMAKEVYKLFYWDAIKGDLISSQDLAASLFDFAVNAGVFQAIKSLQTVIKGQGYQISIDGKIGPQTVSLTNFLGPALLNPLAKERIRFYKALAAERPGTHAKYLAGWIKRANSFFLPHPIAGALVLGGVAFLVFKNRQRRG